MAVLPVSSLSLSLSRAHSIRLQRLEPPSEANSASFLLFFFFLKKPHFSVADSC